MTQSKGHPGDALPTKLRLAAALREVPQKYAVSQENAARYEAFAKRAETGEFNDYGSKYACPITQLYNELAAAGFQKFAQRVANGEFDATKEESDAWAKSPDGQATFRMLSKEMRVALFGTDPVDTEH